MERKVACVFFVAFSRLKGTLGLLGWGGLELGWVVWNLSNSTLKKALFKTHTATKFDIFLIEERDSLTVKKYLFTYSHDTFIFYSFILNPI